MGYFWEHSPIKSQKKTEYISPIIFSYCLFNLVYEKKKLLIRISNDEKII